MSAIYIPKLAIPERGSKFICIREDGTVCDLHGKPLGMKAVEIAAHDRCVDVGELEKRMSDTVQGDIRGYPYDGDTWATAFDWLDHANTVLPADPPDPAEKDDTALCTKCKSGRSPLCKYCPGDSGADPEDKEE